MTSCACKFGSLKICTHPTPIESWHLAAFLKFKLIVKFKLKLKFDLDSVPNSNSAVHPYCLEIYESNQIQIWDQVKIAVQIKTCILSSGSCSDPILNQTHALAMPDPCLLATWNWLEQSPQLFQSVDICNHWTLHQCTMSWKFLPDSMPWSLQYRPTLSQYALAWTALQIITDCLVLSAPAHREHKLHRIVFKWQVVPNFMANVIFDHTLTSTILTQPSQWHLTATYCNLRSLLGLLTSISWELLSSYDL